MRRLQMVFGRIGIAHPYGTMMQHGLKTYVRNQKQQSDHGGFARAIPHRRSDQSADDNGGEIRVDDEGRWDLRAPVRERGENHGAEGGDDVAGDVHADAQGAHAHEGAPGIFSAHE